MEMKFLLFCLLVIATSCSAQLAQVGFGEVDFSAVENSGGRFISVLKDGVNTDQLTVIVRALTIEEFGNLANRTLRSDLVNRTRDIDPAEFTADRQDFNASIEEVVLFSASNVREETQVFIPYLDDGIDEAEEGFLVIVEMGANTPPFDFSNEGVALMTITDNEVATIGFEIGQFTVNEGAGMQDDLITKDIVSEQTLVILVDLSVSTSLTNPAVPGADFNIISLPATIDFSPDVQMLSIPVNISEDDILEPTEIFVLILSRPANSPNYNLGLTSTTVSILDNEIGRVGIEQPEYTGIEGGTVEICVRLFFNGSVSADFVVGADLFADDDSASGADHSFPAFGEAVTLVAPDFRMCFTVDLTDDSEVEGTERFTVRLESFPGATPPNVVLEPISAAVFINDSDALTPTPSPTPPVPTTTTDLSVPPSSSPSPSPSPPVSSSPSPSPSPSVVFNGRGDPHYSVLLPTGQLLCFSVHGEKDFTFNLISNDLLQMNARFIRDPIREEITWIGSLGIVVKNTPNPYSRSNITKLRFEAGEKKVYIGDKVSLVAQRVERLTFNNGKLTISENPSLKKRKRHNVLVELKDVGLSFSVMFVKDHLDLSWKRVDEQSCTFHGMIGQFFRNGNEVDETRKLLLLPNLDPVPVMRREVWHFMEREMVDDQLCWVAMNPGYQGKRLIEGHYLDYLVDDVLAGDFKFIGNSPKTI